MRDPPPFRSFITSAARAGSHHAMQNVAINCLPNAGCTLVALFICAQLARNSTGNWVPVACVPDNLLPDRNSNATRATAHHTLYKAKVERACECQTNTTAKPDGGTSEDGGEKPWPLEGELKLQASRHHVRRILVVRDPLANWNALWTKPSLCAGFLGKLRQCNGMFEYATSASHRSPHDFFDAVIFAEDMQYPQRLRMLLSDLLGRDHIGDALNPPSGSDYVQAIVGPHLSAHMFNRSRAYSQYSYKVHVPRSLMTDVRKDVDLGSQMLLAHNYKLGYDQRFASLGNIHGSLEYTWKATAPNLAIVRQGAQLVRAVAPSLAKHYGALMPMLRITPPKARALLLVNKMVRSRPACRSATHVAVRAQPHE